MTITSFLRTCYHLPIRKRKYKYTINIQSKFFSEIISKMISPPPPTLMAAEDLDAEDNGDLDGTPYA